MQNMATFLQVFIMAALLCAVAFAERQLLQQEAGPKANRPAQGGTRAAQTGGLMTCGDAQRLGKTSSNNLCCAMCFCIGNQSKQPALSRPAVQNLCKNKCSACVVAANKCKSPSDPLPKECAEGLSFTPAVRELVNTCSSMYVANPVSVKQARGC